MISFPFIKQRDSMQCGVAALWMVCRHLGLRCSLRELEERCFPTKEGVSLKGIADAAATVGLEGKGGKATIDMLGRLPLPCILHWNKNHFVVLYRVSRDSRKFRIADHIEVVDAGRMEEDDHDTSMWLPGHHFLRRGLAVGRLVVGMDLKKRRGRGWITGKIRNFVG